MGTSDQQMLTELTDKNTLVEAALCDGLAALLCLGHSDMWNETVRLAALIGESVAWGGFTEDEGPSSDFHPRWTTDGCPRLPTQKLVSSIAGAVKTMSPFSIRYGFQSIASNVT